MWNESIIGHLDDLVPTHIQPPTQISINKAELDFPGVPHTERFNSVLLKLYNVYLNHPQILFKI